MMYAAARKTMAAAKPATSHMASAKATHMATSSTHVAATAMAAPSVSATVCSCEVGSRYHQAGDYSAGTQLEISPNEGFHKCAPLSALDCHVVRRQAVRTRNCVSLL